MSFDPGAAASADSGIYGLLNTVAEAAAVVIPVPFAPTMSYGGGAERGPEAVLQASKQVDLFDIELGRVYEPGIAMLDIPGEVKAWHADARDAAAPVIENGGNPDNDSDLAKKTAEVNALGERVNGWVERETQKILAAKKLPVLIGGDHAAPFGAIKAVADAHRGMGILHFDAHADLRDAYEGFTWSHASIFFNVSKRIANVSHLTHVAIRDVSEAEVEMIDRGDGRHRAVYDVDFIDARARGGLSQLIDHLVAPLPKDVYISFDVDGLDPSLCPGTGTPVPGGLAFGEACAIIRAVVRSGRRIVGLDLCEVSPGERGEWDGNVGARLLYKMIGWAFASRGAIVPRRP